MRRLNYLWVCAFIFMACDSERAPLDRNPTSDSGLRDAGGQNFPDAAIDSGPADIGPTDTGPTDIGPLDAGPSDIGPADTGPSDTGPGDSGPADAGPPPGMAPSDIPDGVFYGSDEVIYLYVQSRALIYRYDIMSAAYLSAIPLGSAPGLVTYASANHRLYVSYASGVITLIDLAQGASEQIFAQLPSAAHGLAAAEQILLAADNSGAWNTHYTFRPDGTQVSVIEWNRRSRDYSWSAATSRLYFFRDGTSPNDLHFEQINTATGEITEDGETPYHGDYALAPPIRASATSGRVLVGSGDIYDGRTMELIASLPTNIRDAVWLPDGSVIAVENSGNRTRMERWAQPGPTYDRIDLAFYPGAVVGLLEYGGRIVLVTYDLGTLYYTDIIPTDDGDGDGVPYTMDAFPTDPAASVDSDGDGYPDEWNPGQSQATSTTGLVLDVFPNDSACWLASHALPSDPTTCDVANGVPSYVPDETMLGTDDTLYFFSRTNSRIYRWSLQTDYHLNPIVITRPDPLLVTYAPATQRIYVAHDSGAIDKIDLAGNNAISSFTALPARPHGLLAAESILLSADPSGAWNTHYTHLPDGTRISAVEWNRRSGAYAWSSGTGRAYFFRDGSSPNDIHWESIDTFSGAITGEGESPYHGAYALRGPIRPSPSGSHILTGTGDMYDGTTLTLVNSLPNPLDDGLWLADGSIVTLRAAGGRTQLEQWQPTNGQFLLVNTQTYLGTPIRVVSSPTYGILVITDVGARPSITSYVPTDDGDGDGVGYLVDAFPNDPAASVDTDHDGAPDAWNPGSSAAQSSTGLVLDAFPFDSACQLASHGLQSNPAVCDIEGQIPAYVPDDILVDQDKVIHLLHRASLRVYRWSMTTGAHENPIVLGSSPTHFAYSEQSRTMYLAHAIGTIDAINLAVDTATVGPQLRFATLPSAPHGLATAGAIVLAADASGAWNTHYTFLPDGTLVSASEWNRRSSHYAWSGPLGRMFFFRNGTSPNDLEWEEIDSNTGVIGLSGDSPYHGQISVVGPIRIADSGSHILLGSGDLFDGASLSIVASLPTTVTDAVWRPDGTLLTVRTSGSSGIVERWSAMFTPNGSSPLPGRPLRIFTNGMSTVVVTSGPTGVNYTTLPL